MILVIAAKHKFVEHLSMAASVNCFLISMAKVFSLSKLPQQSTHLQVFFSWDVMYKIIAPIMSSFYQNKLLQNDRSINKRFFGKVPSFWFTAAIHAHNFWKNKKGFAWVIFARVSTIISCAPRPVDLQKELSIHQIFHLLNKKIQKKIQEIFLSTEWIALKSFIRQNRLIDIAPEHYFYVTLAGFEQIINNDLTQLEAESLNDINYFSSFLIIFA